VIMLNKNYVIWAEAMGWEVTWLRSQLPSCYQPTHPS